MEASNTLRPAVRANEYNCLTTFLALLNAIVTGFAEALQVGLIEEQPQISLVRSFMVNGCSRANMPTLQAVGTQRVNCELPKPERQPPRRLVKTAIGLCCNRPTVTYAQGQTYKL